MNYIKKTTLVSLCFFFFLLVCIVGVSCKKNPYLINIQYQSQLDPGQDGVEKIIVSEIEGVRDCTFEEFKYNEEEERYEYEIGKTDSAYLNLFLNPFLQKFAAKFEYRLKYEDSTIDQSDRIVVTVYSGRNLVRQEIFSLFDGGVSRRYNLDWLLGEFILLVLISFIFCANSALRMVHNGLKRRFFVGMLVTAVWCVIWFIGLHTGVVIKRGVFNKYCSFLMGLALLSILADIVRNAVLKNGKKCVMDRVKTIVPAIVFFIVTCIIYIPSSLYLGNISEFAMPYYCMAGGLLILALVCFIILIYVGLKISNAKGQYIYALVLFFITAGFYIQSNFLNPSLPDLNGEAINWDSYAKERVIGWIGWGCLGVILIVLISMALYKNVKMEKTIRYLSVLLSLMQLCSLTFLIFTYRLPVDTTYKVFEKEGQFTVGDENIIIFVVDCLQVDAVQTYIENCEDAKETLEDFTLFENTIGGGAPTKYAVPLILSGMEYDPMQNIDEYNEEIWQEGELIQNLKQNSYDVRLYTEPNLLPEMPINLVDNLKQTSWNDIGDPVMFYRKLARLSNFYMMPLDLKEHFWLSTEELWYCLENGSTTQAYWLEDVLFYDEFCQKHLQKRNGKTFRFFHLFGVHSPYSHDEKFESITDNTSEECVLEGVMMLIDTYMDELKKLGVYDNSTIVILGDHGRHNTTDAEKYPAIMVKRAGERHPLQHSDNPVCFRNLVATIGSEIKDDYAEYGPGLFDVGQESDVQRLQTLDKVQTKINAQYDGELYADSETGARFIVDDDGAGNLTYREWNPYEINRISYTYGDVIDFRSSDFYADSLTERLYPVENGKTASNELTICFDLPEQKTGDLELGFTYAGVYNDTQKIRIYANGHKVDNVMCTTDQIGKETSVVIPKQYIKEKPVIVRMVFPNAVTPNQLDRSNPDTRVLSVTFDKMWLKVANS